MQSSAHWILVAVLAPAAITIPICALGRLLEALRPAADCPFGAFTFNLLYLLPENLLHAVTVPAVAALAVLLTNRLGGGIIVLPSSGWQLLPAVAVFTLAMDLGEYLFHRAQHKIPILWEMHSLHHSDPAMNISTTQRHFWLEQALKSITIYLAAGLLFRANPTIVAIYGILSLWNFFVHMNLRIGFGRAWFILNSPQFHRLHHSVRPEHYNRNFAALFTVFDALFRTAHLPAPHEYPPTGLANADAPRSLVEAVIWPLRNRAERPRGSAPWTPVEDGRP